MEKSLGGSRAKAAGHSLAGWSFPGCRARPDSGGRTASAPGSLRAEAGLALGRGFLALYLALAPLPTRRPAGSGAGGLDRTARRAAGVTLP